jgi:hypothetical protein
MSVIINGKTYYKTSEACKLAGVSRATLFRWLKNRTYEDVPNKDRRGWRLFAEDDVKRLREEAHRIRTSPSQLILDFNQREKGRQT